MFWWWKILLGDSCHIFYCMWQKWCMCARHTFCNIHVYSKAALVSTPLPHPWFASCTVPISFWTVKSFVDVSSQVLSACIKAGLLSERSIFSRGEGSESELLWSNYFHCIQGCLFYSAEFGQPFCFWLHMSEGILHAVTLMAFGKKCMGTLGFAVCVFCYLFIKLHCRI